MTRLAAAQRRVADPEAMTGRQEHDRAEAVPSRDDPAVRLEAADEPTTARAPLHDDAPARLEPDRPAAGEGRPLRREPPGQTGHARAGRSADEDEPAGRLERLQSALEERDARIRALEAAEAAARDAARQALFRVSSEAAASIARRDEALKAARLEAQRLRERLAALEADRARPGPRARTALGLPAGLSRLMRPDASGQVGTRGQAGSPMEGMPRDGARHRMLRRLWRVGLFRGQLRRSIDRLHRSGVFDADWYLDRNPDVAASGIDPARHFIEFGCAEGRAPSARFEGSQ
jgi:hypothetical protein